jgi:hypothetical protein
MKKQWWLEHEKVRTATITLETRKKQEQAAQKKRTVTVFGAKEAATSLAQYVFTFEMSHQQKGKHRVGNPGRLEGGTCHVRQIDQYRNP